MKLNKMTLKENVSYFVEQERMTRDVGESFLDVFHSIVLNAFIKDYRETCDFIVSANEEELDCFLSVLCDFIEHYPNEEIVQLCTDRKVALETGYQYDFEEEINWAIKYLSEQK